MVTSTRWTLRGLCDAAGADLLDVVVAPRGLDVPVAGIVLHDPLDAPGAGLSSGDVVLAVGRTWHDQATGDLIRAAGAAGAAAVVFRRRAAPPGAWPAEAAGAWPATEAGRAYGTRPDGIPQPGPYGEAPDAILRAAQRAGPAVLAIGPDLPWSWLDVLLRTWRASDRAGGPPRATGGNPAELAALADDTAEAAGGPVTIEDTDGNVLAFSRGGQEVDPVRAATVLRRRVPEQMMRRLRRHGFFTRLMNTDDVVDVRLPDMPARRGVAIRAGGAVLGVIWLVPGAGSDPPDGEDGTTGGRCDRADTALRNAARIAALHITRRRVSAGLEGRVRAGTMAMLLRGRGDPGPARERLGLPRSGGLVLLALAAGPGRESLDQLVDLVVTHLAAYRRRAAGAVLDDRVYVLAVATGDEAVHLVRRTVDECLARARRRVGADSRAGMSELLAGWRDIPRGRRDADRALELGASANRVVSIAEVHGRALLADVQDFLTGRRLSLSRQLRVLLDHDRDNGTAYVATLRSFLDAESDAVRAAARLAIHVNTMRYRIRRILEITGADLADPDTRLGLELQLRVLERPGVLPEGTDTLSATPCGLLPQAGVGESG